MYCTVRENNENKRGIFLGLMINEHGNIEAVVRIEKMGMFVHAFHPSSITLMTED